MDLQKIKTIDQLSNLVFEKGYEFKSKESGLYVAVMKPHSFKNSVEFHLSDGRSGVCRVGDMHQLFDAVKAN
jgi:hypothetical protein